MPPEVSVVAPTHNRPAGLATLMRALERQSLDTGRFEVILVDDGSSPPAAAASGRLDLRVLRNDPGQGPASARNRGWHAASAPLIAFVDDDCEPSPRWLESLLATAAAEGEQLIVQGPVAPTPGQAGDITPVSHTMAVGGPSPLCVTCNIAYTRDVLEATGGFDESFRRACGEDAELGARALKAGARIVWSDGALVHHEVRPGTLAAALRQTTKWTDSVRVMGMHPELRELLVARVFWRPTHPLLLAAVAGLATRRPLLTLTAAALYARHHRRTHANTRDLVRWLPAHVAIDACEIGTAIAGSVQHRTLMI